MTAEPRDIRSDQWPSPSRRLRATKNQQRFVRAELSGAGSYMVPVGHLTEGQFDPSQFRRAAMALVRRHEALRTRYEISEGEIFALIDEEPRLTIRHREMTDRSFQAFRAWALPLIYDDVDPSRAETMIRFVAADYGDAWRVTIAGHHSTRDGFSANILNQDFFHLYVGEDLPPTTSFYDHPESTVIDPEIEARCHALAEALPKPVSLIGDGIRDETPAAGHFVERAFRGAYDLRPLAQSIGASRFGLMAAIYALGLRGFSGERALSTAFQSEGRRAIGVPNTVVGSFANTLPLDLSADRDMDFADFAKLLTARSREAVALAHLGLADEVLKAQKWSRVSINLYPTAAPITAQGLKIGPRELLDRRSEYDLNLLWTEEEGALRALAYYNRAHLSAERVGLFLDLQKRLLDAVLEDPHRSCGDVLARARASCLSLLPQQSVEPAPQTRLHARFFDWAARAPDRTAIVSSDREISYAALADQARRIAGGVKSAGLGAGDTVAIYAARGPEMVAAMLGVSASGAAFAVIDADYPSARIIQMVEDLGARCALEAGAQLPKDIARRLTVLQAGDTAAELVEGTPRDIAYHLFTSGTSGRPKLISHPDQALQRFIAWQHEEIASAEPAATLMMAGLAHDPTLRDLFLPLSHGGRVAIPSPEEMRAPEALRALIAKAGCNIVRFSPASARLLATGMEGPTPFAQLKAIFWGGERLPRHSVRQWRDWAPNARQFNVFGATETPQAFLIHEIASAEDGRRDIPIGRALPWTGARLVDEDGAPVSTGEVGEIVAEMADPIHGADDRSANGSAEAATRHHTGDLGYQGADGAIYYAGRRDGQIKLNGYRIELTEIEAAAESNRLVEQAAARLLDGVVTLFVLSRSRKVTERSMRGALALTLPAYMVPGHIIVRDALPTTPNNKLDEAALAGVAAAHRATGAVRVHVKPKGAAEEAIAALFAKHSGRSDVGRDQSLIDLGADSLSTIEARLGLEAMGAKPPDNWQNATVAELAKSAPAGTQRNPWNIFRGSRIETFILIRCFAIIAIVAGHNELILVDGGASITLLALAGFSFCRLQLPSILRDRHAGRVWAMLARLLVLLIPISLLYFAKRYFVDDDVVLYTVLWTRNLAPFIETILLGGVYTTGTHVWLWFIHAYLQIFVCLGLLLSFDSVRRRLAADLWRALAGFFLLAEALGLLTLLAVSALNQSAASTASILELSPTTLLPFVSLGALVAAAESRRRLAISFGFVLCHFGLSQVAYYGHEELWWVLILGLCVLFPHLTLPRALVGLAIVIAAHSLTIYLSHHAFKSAYLIFAGADASQAGGVLIQIALGVALGEAARPLIARLGVHRLANRPPWSERNLLREQG